MFLLIKVVRVTYAPGDWEISATGLASLNRDKDNGHAGRISVSRRIDIGETTLQVDVGAEGYSGDKSSALGALKKNNRFFARFALYLVH